jgi:acetyltransferase-like isoleucine patch superfamily enzyme
MTKHIHPTALVSPGAHIGRNVTIGAYTVVYDNVTIGNDSVIDSHCVIGKQTELTEGKSLTIGARALIRSHSVLYAGSTYGDGLTTGHFVTLREKITAGPGLVTGSYSDFQGQLSIGNYVRTQSYVLIGQQATIEDFVWIFSFTILLNDPHPPSMTCKPVHIKSYAVIAASCCLFPGVTIGKGALVGAGSMVKKDVSPDSCFFGNPARFRCKTSSIRMKGKIPAYPWTRHYHKNYPQDVVAAWLENAAQAEKKKS